VKESGYLDDVVEFVISSGAAGDEEMLSCTRPDGSRIALKTKTVREELKRTFEGEGLPPTYFSSHSLRKGAIMHMRALVASEDDRRDRGSCAPGSDNEQYVRLRGRPRTVSCKRSYWRIHAHSQGSPESVRGSGSIG
jgi:hypothetical protein